MNESPQLSERTKRLLLRLQQSSSSGLLADPLPAPDDADYVSSARSSVSPGLDLLQTDSSSISTKMHENKAKVTENSNTSNSNQEGRIDEMLDKRASHTPNNISVVSNNLRSFLAKGFGEK